MWAVGPGRKHLNQNLVKGTWKRGQFVKCLPCKHEVMSLDVQDPRKRGHGTSAWISVLGSQKQAGDLWIASLSKAANSGFGERLCQVIRSYRKFVLPALLLQPALSYDCFLRKLDHATIPDSPEVLLGNVGEMTVP